METVLKFLNAIHPLSVKLKEYLATILQTKEIPEGSHFLKAGWICDKIAFIEKGLFRCYYLIEEKEVNSWFMKEGDVIISVSSFFDQSVSYQYIEALEDSIIHYISFKEYDFLKRNYHEFNSIRADLLEHYYRLSDQRQHSTLSLSAIMRFQLLFERNQELLMRVPEKYLAAYLGMNASTFSRNKSEFFKGQIAKPNGCT